MLACSRIHHLHHPTRLLLHPLLSTKNTHLLNTTTTRSITQAQRAAQRAARKQRATQFLQQHGAGPQTSSSSSSSSSSSIPKVSTNALWYLGFTIPTALLTWGIYDETSPPAQFANLIGLSPLVESLAEGFVKPSRDKLLPDWSQMVNVPQDIPVPHTLVLDLEDTLVSSTWDRKYGWRHAKRPGVDKFLTTLSQYYEIVLFSPSPPGMADEVINALDKHGCVMHRLHRDAMLYKKGAYVKDLSKLNRNVRRIVALDDDVEALQLHPGNLIRVKPYTDPTDREDRTLLNIIPLLVEIADEKYDDVPALLRQFEGMDADEMAEEYQRRIEQVREERTAARTMGGLGRLAPRVERMKPELAPMEDPSLLVAASPGQLTSKDLVGSSPFDKEGGGGVMGWLNKRTKDKQEEQMRKMEKWNEVMMKKQMEKRKKEEERAAQMGG